MFAIIAFALLLPLLVAWFVFDAIAKRPLLVLGAATIFVGVFFYDVHSNIQADAEFISLVQWISTWSVWGVSLGSITVGLGCLMWMFQVVEETKNACH